MKKYNSQLGFTLIETVLAAVILAIATAGIVFLLQTTLESSNKSVVRSQAIFLLQEKAEMIRNIRDNNVMAKRNNFTQIDNSIETINIGENSLKIETKVNKNDQLKIDIAIIASLIVGDNSKEIESINFELTSRQ